MGWLPEPIQAYFVPVEGLSNFVFFPWIGLVFAGAFAGVLIDAVEPGEQERRLNVAAAGVGAALTAAGYAASFLPEQDATFWTTSWSFLVMRIGIGMMGIAAAYAWTAAAVRPGHWSPMARMGRSSLFIYWVHVEIVYGLISRPWHRGLPLPAVAIALAALTALMFSTTIVKERIERSFRLKPEVTGPPKRMSWLPRLGGR
jgi:predicted acyltransferase